MADNQTITATLQLQDPGSTVDKGTKSLEKLNVQNEKLEKSTKRRSVAAALSEKNDYNANRAIGQGTGAGARDFAKESQGLGGLVRLYATLAANLFAAEAAFRALSNAMNTENMIAGLDQMGATTGQALGAMSKRFAETTGFAISLRDSVEAVSKASSAGLNQQQILQIAEVAKKASQSLGINMTDAVSRLTRGIAKLEPELLDELGLFTKLGKSTEDYAAKIGKPVAALTDFERRQAFANAVLKEGADKFSNINIPTNPYDKLLASMTNLAQTGLTLVNVVLKPLVDLLASSPAALTAVIGALGLAIFKKFIPAVGELRANMREEANKLAGMAENRAAEAKKAFNQTQELRKKALGQEYNDIEQLSAAKIAAADATLKKIAKSGMSKEARKITDPTREISSITEKELSYIDELGKKQTKVSGQYRAWAEAVRDAHKIAREEAEKTSKYNDLINKPASSFTTAGIAQIRAESARRAASSKNVIINASEVASTESLWSGVKKLGEGIKTEKLGLFRGALTGVAGAANIAAVALGNVGTFLSRFLGPIGIIISAWQMLDAVFSTAGKEIEELKSKYEQLSDTIKTVTDVNKKYEMTLTVASINAKATALTNLADTLDVIAPTLEAALAKMGIWTKFWDSVLPEFLGGGVISKIGNKYSQGIVAALNAAITPEAKKEAEQKLAAILNVDPKNITIDKLEKALSNAGADARAKAKGVVDQLKKDTNALNAPLQKSLEGFKSLDKAYLELNNSFINNDVGSKFAVELIGQLNNLSDAFDNPITRTAQLVAIAKDISLVKMFPPEAQKSLIEAANNIDAVTKAIEESKKEMTYGQAKIDAAKGLEQGGMPREVYLRVQVEGEAQLAAATEVHKESTKKLEQINGNLKAGMSSAMSTAIGILEAPLTRALAQANINSQKAVLAAIPRSQATVELTAKLELESIAIRKQEVAALFNLTKSIDLDRLDRNRTKLEEEKKKFEVTGDTKSAGELTKQIDAIKDQEKAFSSKNYRKDFADGMSTEVANIISRRVGFDTKLAGLSGEAELVKIKQITDTVATSFETAAKDRQQRLEALVESNKQERAEEKFTSMQPAEQAARQAQQTAAEKAIQTEGALSQIAQVKATSQALLADEITKKNPKLAAALEDATKTAERDLLLKAQTEKSTERTVGLETERKILALEYVSSTKLSNVELDKEVGLRQQSLTKAQSDIDFAKNKVDFEQQFNALTLDEYANKIRNLEVDAAIIEYQQKRIDQQQNFNKSVQDLVAKQLESGTIFQEDAIAERQNLANNNALALSNTEQQFAARIRLADLEKSRQDYNGKREQEYAKAFERSMDGMVDSFINFAKTGKFSFKDMANAIIQDIARIEIRMQLMQFAANEGGFLAMAKSFLGFGSGPMSPEQIATSANAFNINAKGNVYDGGLMRFAKGGAFSNSIVHNPTMFKFAQGTGLMGEAGPEAIMPLKRDSQGNLGVRTNQQQQNVEVVVNNYGSEKATTKESVNNRGERKIEVIIGDAVAGEISRPGSAVQQSLSSNFGNRPVVARR